MDEKPSNHLYRLLYQIEGKPQGLTKEEAIAKSKEGFGACDAILLASILYPADGSLSVLFIGHDGRTDTELADVEWFKVWSMLAVRLAESTTLSPGKRELCSLVTEAIRRSVIEAGRNESADDSAPE